MKALFEEVSALDSTQIRMRYLIEGVGRNANADRCNVHYVREPGSPIWDNVYEWCAEGMPPVIGTQQGLDLQEFPDLEEAVLKGRAWSFTDIAKLHPATRAKMLPQGVQSFIALPFRNPDGDIVGSISLSFVRTHPDPIPESVLQSMQEAVGVIALLLRIRHEQQEAYKADTELLEMGVGLWSFELDEGAPPRMYGNKAMDDLLGCDGLELTPEEYYHAWYDHIHPDHYKEVDDTVRSLVSGFYAEAQYPFLHPVRGEMMVRCGGRRDPSYTKGVRIVGRHEDISDLMHLQKSAALEVAALQRLVDYERERVEKAQCISLAMEFLVTEPDFVRLVNRVMASWCRALDAQWGMLGRFVDNGFEVVNCFSELGDVPLFKKGESFPYLSEMSGEARDDSADSISVVDFPSSPAARAMAGMPNAPQDMGVIASCHNHVVRVMGRRWGLITFLFQNRRECADTELRFIAYAAHVVELALGMKEHSAIRLELE